MTKLKIILKYSYLAIILLTISYCYNYISNSKYKSKYNLNNSYVEGYIKDIKKKDNKLSITVNDVLINFYNDNIPTNIQIGDYIKVEGELSVPSKNTTPHLFNYRTYLYSINIHYILKPKEYTIINTKIPIIYNIKRKLISYFSHFKSNNYLLTFILGCNYEIDADVISSYNKNGISHLFALSGMHVSMLTCILLFLLTKILSEKKSYLICSLFLIFYIFLTGFSKSIVRASFLFFFLTFKKIFHINLDIKKVYLIFTCFILYLNPYNIYNNAFLFSYIISFSLICFGSIINNYKNYFLKIFITSLISFLVGIPISVNTSFELNFLSPILNIFFVPVISIIIFPLTLLTAFVPFLDSITYTIISILEKISLLCCQVTIFKAIMPHMNIIHIIIYYTLLIITFQYAKKKKYYYTILIIIYLFYLNNLNYFKNYDQITVIDIGQGDSILINLAHNKGTYLIDTGGKYGSTFSYAQNTTIPYLKSLGIKKIDYLILTHGDYDHAGEANYIINNFKVNHVIFNCGHYNYLERELIKLLESKNIKYASCVSMIDNLSFLQTMDFNNENDNSIVIYTKINNYSFMFMGDASIKTEAEIMKKYNLPKIDILKAGHHGSNTSSSKEFIDTINPDYTLISVGLNNKFKHPHQETLDNLVNSKIYRTDLDGSITIYIKNRQLHISSF